VFDRLFSELMDPSEPVAARMEGVAFLKSASTIYKLAGISYLAINVPKKSTEQCYVHYSFSSHFTRQVNSHERIPAAKLDETIFLRASNSQSLSNSTFDHLLHCGDVGQAIAAGRAYGSIIQLETFNKEIALLGFVATSTDMDWPSLKISAARDLRILGTYFHNHMLRLNGVDASAQLIITARELDCLKWSAEGKSALESSIILGITERTVRYHLNSAREKMNCSTTTHAVAKAVAQNLITI
jgi:DNA-binding CsgD family transcriptional regulator